MRKKTNLSKISTLFIIAVMLIQILIPANVFATDLTLNLHANNTPDFIITYDGSNFQVNGIGTYANFSYALNVCDGDGSQVIQLGTNDHPLLLNTTATGINLRAAKYIGGVDFIPTTLGNNRGFRIANADVVFENLEITNNNLLEVLENYSFQLVDIQSGGKLMINAGTNITAKIGTNTQNTSDAAIAVNTGELIINGGNIALNSTSVNGGRRDGIYVLNGIVAINGGTISTDSGTHSSGNWSAGVQVTGENAVVTIGAGEIIGIAAGVRISGGTAGLITINGGTIEATTNGTGGAILISNGKVEMNGGIAKATGSGGGSNGISNSGGELVVNGGEITTNASGHSAAGINISANHKGSIIKGGEIRGIKNGIYASHRHTSPEVVIENGIIEATGVGGNGITLGSSTSGESGILRISGGNIRATDASSTANAGIYSAGNGGNFKLFISGGNISNNSTNTSSYWSAAIYQHARTATEEPHLEISGDAVIQGTFHGVVCNADHTDTGVGIKISGGMITANDIAFRNYSKGTVKIEGGNITTSHAFSPAIRNDGDGRIEIVGGTIQSAEGNDNTVVLAKTISNPDIARIIIDGISIYSHHLADIRMTGKVDIEAGNKRVITTSNKNNTILTATNLTSGNYFHNWTSDSARSTSVSTINGDSLGNLSANENTNIYLKANSDQVPVMYTVQFESNGGTPVNAITVLDGSTINVPEAPTKANATFVGWYKEDTFQNLWDFENDIVNSNIILYAKWQEPLQFTIGTVDNAGEGNIVSIPIKVDQIGEITAFNLSFDYDREKLEFAGWDGTGSIFGSTFNQVTSRSSIAAVNHPDNPIDPVLGFADQEYRLFKEIDDYGNTTGQTILGSIKFKILSEGASTVTLELDKTAVATIVHGETVEMTKTVVAGGVEEAKKQIKIKGKVMHPISANSNGALAGVNISLKSKEDDTVIATATTDQNGDFETEILELKLGQYVISYTKPQYSNYQQEINITQETGAEIQANQLMARWGDVDGNAIINSIDVARYWAHLVKGIAFKYPEAADVNRDGDIDSNDVLMLWDNITEGIAILSNNNNKSTLGQKNIQPLETMEINISIEQVENPILGEIIKVPVKVDQVGKIAAFNLNFNYDRERLEFVGWDGKDSVFGNAFNILTSKSNLADVNAQGRNPVLGFANSNVLIFEEDEAYGEIVGEGILGSILFKVLKEDIGEIQLLSDTSISTVANGRPAKMNITNFTLQVVPQIQGRENISSERPTVLRFVANQEVHWEVNISNPQGKLIKTFNHVGNVFEESWAPSPYHINNGEYIVSITAQKGNQKIEKQEVLKVYNYPVKNREIKIEMQGKQGKIQASIENLGPQSQSPMLIVQVKDKNGSIIYLGTAQMENLPVGQKILLNVGTAFELGEYMAEIFVWDSWEGKNPLSEKHVKDFVVE